MDVDEPVQVYEAWNLAQAQFLCNMLEEAGIAARVASSAVEMLSGKVPFQKVTCPVWVAAGDRQRARAMIAEYERRLAGHGPKDAAADEPFCYHCGQPVQPAASPCPSCGLELDWSE